MLNDNSAQWDRVTFSRLTKFYFAFSVLHCIIQVVFQVQAFVANANAAKFLEDLIQQGNATDPGFAVYDGDLRMCESVPSAIDASSCTVVWDGHTAANVSLDVSDSSYAAVNASTTAASTSLTSSLSTSGTPISVASSLFFTRLVSSTSAPSSSSVVSSAASSTALSSSSVATSSSRAASSSVVTVSSVRTLTATVTFQTATLLPSVTAISSPKINISTDDSDSEDESDDESDDEFDSDDEDDTLVIHLHGRDIVLPETKIRLMLNGNATVNLGGLYGQQEIELERKCLYALNWPCDMYVPFTTVK